MFEFITQLDLYKYLVCKRPRLSNHKGENRLQLEIVDRLRALSIEGKLKAVWFHPPNEMLVCSCQKASKNGWNILLSMMGRMPGVADLVFTSENKTLYMELKIPGGKQTDNQKTFERWCKNHSIPYVICRSWDEAKNCLIENNFIDKDIS